MKMRTSRQLHHRSITGMLLVLFFIAASPLHAAESKASEAKAGSFTVESIEPDAEKQTVRIQFSAPVPLKAFIEKARFFPFAYLSEYDAKQLAPNILQIHSDFEYGKHYVLSLPDDFSASGKRYKKTINSFDMPDLRPAVAFLEPGSVIERDSRQMLHLRVTNADRIGVKTVRTPPLVLPLALDLEKNWKAHLSDDWRSILLNAEDKVVTIIGSEPAFSGFLADPSESREIFSAKGAKNKAHAFSVPLTFRDAKERGAIELIRVEGVDEDAEAFSGARIYRITDIGITYKRSKEGLLIWTTSLRDGSPKNDVSLLAVTANNEIFPIGKTDASGLLAYGNISGSAALPTLKGLRVAPGEDPAPVSRAVPVAEIDCLIAGASNDVAYIQVGTDGELNLEKKGITSSDKNWSELKFLHGAVFTERGVYRPGEEVHFKGVVRRNERGALIAPEGSPCVFTVKDSRNETVYEETLKLNRFGSAWGTLKIEPHRPLGSYSIEMKFGPELEYAETASFQVQEFEPPRHYVRVSFEEARRTNDDYVNRKIEEDVVRIKIAGLYYAGGPVKHGIVRWKVYHADAERQAPTPEHADCTFGYVTGFEEDLVETGESILDDKGEATVDFPLGKDVLTGKRALRVVATVVDFDGRVVSGKGLFQKDLDCLVGIAPHPEKMLPNKTQSLKALVMDKKGAPIADGILEASVMQEDGYHVPYRSEDGSLDWEYEDAWRSVYTSSIPIRNGDALFEFNIGKGGRYLVSFTYRDKDGRAVVSATGLEVEGDSNWSSYDEGDREFESLTMASDKEVYEPGETATIHLFPTLPVAYYLVTVEQDGVLDRRVVPAKEAANGISLPIQARYAPNVYASVLGISPRGDFPMHMGQFDSEAPAFLLGVLNLSVRNSPEELTVRIAPSQTELKAEPGAEIQLDLEVAGKNGAGAPVELAIGVVNESVLALTGYKTPDLGGLTHFSGPLGVHTKELRSFLLHQTPFRVAHVKPLTGGDGDEENEGDTSEIRKNFNPVAYFNPAVETDAQGKARISFKLPDAMTSYRITVVACDAGGRFGAAQRNMTVAKPFYVEPGLPRFFTEGDKFRFPVTAFNHTGAEGAVALDPSGDDRLKLSAEDGGRATLGPQDSAKLYVRGEALKTGDSTVYFTGKLGDRKDVVQLTLPVVCAQAIGTEAAQGSFEKQATVRLAIPKELLAAPWAQVGYGDVSATLSVSGSPFLHLEAPLHYLLKYPYGCVEQTSSGIIALAGLRGLIGAGMVPGVGLEEADRFLTKGIERLLSMQLSSGGFGYWPGYGNEHPWGSIYAASALTIAKLAGSEIPEDRFDRLQEYMKKQVQSGDADMRFKAFAAFMLSLSDSLDAETMKAVGSPYKGDDLTASLTYALATRARDDVPFRPLAEKALQPPAKGEPVFNARYLNPALALILVNERAPGDPLAARLEQKLLDGIGKGGVWTSTSDTGWALYALGEHLKAKRIAREGSFHVTVKPASGAGETATMEGLGAHVFQLDPKTMLDQPEVSVESNAPGALYYRLEMRLPRFDYAANGHAAGFRVWKTIESADGGDSIRIGDIVKVTVNVEADNAENRYVMVDDPLPAGLVAINSAFETEEPDPGEDTFDRYEGSYWTSDGYFNFRPNFFEMRDQRVLAYRDALWGGKGAYRLCYYARAVCEGDFNIAPTKVEAMYNPEVNGFTTAGKLRIVGR